MIIESISIAGFKNIPISEPKSFNFYSHTIITGENFTGKTSIGDALCWVFCGCSSTGITADYLLRNDNSSKIAVEVVFEDNNEQIHSLLREQKQDSGKNHRLILDGLPAKESDLEPFILNSEIFLSTFMIGYFSRLTSKLARELLMQVLPFPSHQSIIELVDADVRSYIPTDDNFDSNTFLRQMRLDLKNIENEIKLWQDKQKTAAVRISLIPSVDLINEIPLKSKIEMLEKRKENFLKASMQNDSIGFLEGKLSLLRIQTENLENQLITPKAINNKLCPTCKQPIGEEYKREMDERINSSNNLIIKQIEKLKVEETDYNKRIETDSEKSNECRAIQEELNSAEIELQQAKIEYEKIIRQNEAARSEKNNYEESRRVYDTAKERLEKLSTERYRLNRSIVAVTQYNSIKSDLQFDTIRGSLKNVSIRFQKLNAATNELKDCFELLYKGREFQQISTSEGIRAGIEISNLVSSRTGLKVPIFIDNAESITHYDKPDTQVFEAKVQKDGILKIINQI